MKHFELLLLAFLSIVYGQDRYEIGVGNNGDCGPLGINCINGNKLDSAKSNVNECDCMNEKIEPICCLDMDYKNKCEAECDGSPDINECKMGLCNNECFCPQDFKPLCCDERNDYKNQCFAKCWNENLKYLYDTVNVTISTKTLLLHTMYP